MCHSRGMESSIEATTRSQEDIEQIARLFDALLESALSNGFIDKKGKVSSQKG